VSSGAPHYLARNIENWADSNQQYGDARAEQSWAKDEITYGVFGIPESEVRVLPEFAGKDVVEIGCGTAYFGSWLKKLGAARVVGVDPTPAQLATARRCNEKFGLGLELIEAYGESLPLPDDSFDLAVSEYGASIWADPVKWIPEAARVLRPGGHLVFLRNTTVSMLCMGLEGQTESLQRPQREIAKVTWEDTGETEFHPSTGELFDILSGAGFVVERLAELYPREDAETHEYYKYVTVEWAKKWAAEEIWRARLQPQSS
jgi:ubiquinone/menaquinone biosynthesis C-methylase UbiE